MEHIGIRAGGGETRDQRILKHIAGAAGVLTNHDSGRAVLSAAPPDLGVIPAQKTAYPIGVIRRQGHVGFSPEAVRTKIFTHDDSPYLLAAMIPPVL